ncbi:MAG: phosphoribosylformylglycinamidine cyclo-ligase [Dehalococcoidales bacterium]|nr:MAG: phosphoribosylformylglycinamidine cyclo-ligase [Dehalococcoidales bacterium]
MKKTYAEAGVDIDAKAGAIKEIGQLVKATYRKEVLSGVGLFGSMFEFKGYNEPVLVSSIDGVGTKLKLATALDRYETVGIDIVNHCVNDIFACGAEPLYFLDYIGTGKVLPDKLVIIAQGLADACKEVGCALIGGEIAEMPGIYSGKDYDLVGVITGVVEKSKIINGSTIKPGDIILGLPSSGLHTNGYSLIRNIFGETKEVLEVNYPELGQTLGEALLEPHRCYYNQLKPHLPLIKGMAHITGGGLLDNVPRILPEGTAAQLDSSAWTVPPIFKLIQERGNIDLMEMYHVFNMGIGMVVVCSPEDSNEFFHTLPETINIGMITIQDNDKRVLIG